MTTWIGILGRILFPLSTFFSFLPRFTRNISCETSEDYESYRPEPTRLVLSPAPQEKLPESACLLDLPEHRLAPLTVFLLFRRHEPFHLFARYFRFSSEQYPLSARTSSGLCPDCSWIASISGTTCCLSLAACVTRYQSRSEFQLPLRPDRQFVVSDIREIPTFD